MESINEKENLYINKKKRKQQVFNNKEKIDNITDSSMSSQVKKKKFTAEMTADDDKKNYKSDLFQVVKNKTEFENIMKDYVVHEEDEQSSSRKKISKRKMEKLKKVKTRKEKSLPAKDPAAEERTIFVGNVNINASREKVENFFSKYGEIETVRFRGITPESMNMTKKEAVAKKLFNPHRKSLNAYVRFKNAISVEKALKANGSIFEDLHIHVDRAMATIDKDKNSVFVGNLPWEINEEDLWQFFDSCGKIINVRIVRSSETGAGKGFGFVSFGSNDGVEMALHFDGKTLMNRHLRVKKTVKKAKDQSSAGASRRLDVKKKKKNAMNVSFLQLDKPQLRVKKIQEKGRKRKPRKNIADLKSLNFSGMKVNKEGKTLKKAKRKSRAEMKKNVLAKKLGYT